MSSLQHSEQLQEALLRLEQTVRQEKKLREESDAILEGLSALVGATNSEEVLSVLRTTFQKLIECSECLIMHKHGDRLISNVTELSFPIGKGFTRVINGGVLNAFDVTQVPEWQGIHRDDICSALHLPLQLSTSTGMLILTAETPAAFTREAIELAQRIIPFTEQAASKLELIELNHMKELEEAHSLLVSLINSVPDLIFYKDTDSVYMGCNTAFCQFISKKCPDEIVGLSDFDLFGSDLAQFFREKDKSMLCKGDTQRNEEWVDYPDGRRVLLDTLKAPYYNGVGEVIGLIGISRDITAFKELEEQFLQAQKMESIGTLVGGIAHEFNNTLAGITGRLFLAKSRAANDHEITRHLDKISILSDRSAVMIQQLLAFSRKSPVQMKKFDLTVFIKETFKLHKFSIPENIALNTQFSHFTLPIKADSTQIQQILVNLLHNARDAVHGVEQPSITVSLGLFEADELFTKTHSSAIGEDYAHLMVEDNGCGISIEDKVQIFDPFFTTKDVGKGTGLGLAMVYGAIKTHNGMIEVDSKLGKGTKIDVYLPLESSSSLHKTMQEPQLSHGHGEYILFVDDEPEVRETGREVLESLGYTILEASNGSEAIEIFLANENAIVLTILDVVMPVLGGVEAALAIKRHKQDAKVIFCTGYDKEDVLDAKDIGENPVITKPYSIEKLSQIIQEQLADR